MQSVNVYGNPIWRPWKRQRDRNRVVAAPVLGQSVHGAIGKLHEDAVAARRDGYVDQVCSPYGVTLGRLYVSRTAIAVEDELPLPWRQRNLLLRIRIDEEVARSVVVPQKLEASRLEVRCHGVEDVVSIGVSKVPSQICLLHACKVGVRVRGDSNGEVG